MSRKTDSLFQNYNRVQAKPRPKRSIVVIGVELLGVLSIAGLIAYLLIGV